MFFEKRERELRGITASRDTQGGGNVKICEPIFITKTEKRGYGAVGSVPGYGTIRRYGRSAEEAAGKFFEACERLQNIDRVKSLTRQRTLLTILFAALGKSGQLARAPGELS
jgi:hypothetical protein